MSLNSGANPNLVKTDLDDVLFPAFDAPAMPGFATAENALLFKQKSTTMGAVQEIEFAGPSKWKEHIEEEDVDEASVITDNPTTYNVKNWKQDLPIPKEFYDDDQHDTVTQATADMGRQGRGTRDENAMKVYFEGFTVTTTPDAAYLYSNSHTNLNGNTIDNLETGAMSPDNLELLVRALFLQKDQRGRHGGHNPSALLVPPALFKKATVYTESELEPGGPDNDRNYLSMIYPGLQVFQSPWMANTFNGVTNADTSYFLVGPNHRITRKVREPLNTTLVPWQYDRKDRYIYKGRFREVTYAGTWEGTVASNGTA